jgi:hypothetical protein
VEQRSTAILWDVENVNTRSLKALVDVVEEYAGKFGRLSVAYAFGDWTRRALKGADEILGRSSFQLVHIPKGRKNSADISMVTSGMELLFLYPHVTTYILVTGDSDFRPLLMNMRRRGAETAIICDARSASEDLLELADYYQDFRDLLRADDDMDSADQEEDEGEEAKLTKEQAFSLLSEAVSIMRRNGKRTNLGPTKIRMRLLNENFDERDFGFSSWKRFVLAAKDRGYIVVETKDSDMILSVPEGQEKKAERLSEPIAGFVNAVEKAGGGANGQGVPFAVVGKELKSQRINYRRYGYRNFKRLAEAAEKRGLVELWNRDLEWFIRLTEA